MNKCLKYTLIGGCGIPCLVVVCGIIGVFAMIARFEYVHEHGLDYAGAQYKYFTAMRAGDGQSAVYWAEKTINYAVKEKYSNKNEEWLGYAFELNGQNEEALRVYQELGKESILTDLDVPRVKYKIGQTKEAFSDYCCYAEICLVKYSELLKSKGWNDRNGALGQIRREITMERDGFYMRLSPFLKYKDFLDFMEEEYQKIDEPQKCAAAMELFRAIDKEIGYQATLSSSGAPDELDATREQILAERKEKGVKW